MCRLFITEGVGIEPTGNNAIAPHTALKAGTATRRHPLPAKVYNIAAPLANVASADTLAGSPWVSKWPYITF